MASLKELIVKIGADTRGLESGIDKASGKLSSFGDRATAVGSSLSTSLTLPIVGAGAGILSMAGDFEAGMNKVAAISGATGSDLEALTAQAKEMGSTTKFSASEAAEGMSFLSMAGFDATQTMQAMPGLLSLAAASGMDLGNAADIASNILSGFGLNAAEAGRTADVLAKAAASSNTDVRQLGQAMKFVAPVAANVGMEIEETAAFIGKLGDAGIQAEMAGTNLRGMIAGLIDPSTKAADVLSRLGVETEDSSGKMLPLRNILEQLKGAGASAADMFTLFGRENASAALVLQDSLPGYDALVEKLQTSGGAAQAMADTMQGGLNGAFTSLMSAVEGLAIAIADSGLLDWATGLVVSFTDIVREVSKASPEILKIGTIAAGAAATAGPMLVVIGGMATGLAGLAPLLKVALAGIAALGGGPVSLSILALVGLSGAIVALQDDSSELVTEWDGAWTSVKTVAANAATKVKTDIKAAWEAIVTFSKPIFDQIVRIADTAIGIVRELLALPGVKESIVLVWDAIVAVVRGAWEAITGIISGALTIIEGVLKTGLGILRGDWSSAADGIKLIVEGMWIAIKGVFSGGVTAIRDTVVGMKNAVLGVFSDMGNDLVGNSIVPDEIVDPTIAEFGRLKTGATDEATQLKTSVSGVFGDIATAVSDLNLGDKLFEGSFSLDSIKSTLGSIGDAFKDKMVQPAKDALNNLIDQGIGALMGALDGLIGKLGGVGGAFSGALGGGVPGGGGGGGGGMPGGGGGGGAGGAGGALGAVNVVTGVVTAASSVWGNFQNLEIETGIDAIERETRETKIWIESNVVPALWQIADATAFGPMVKAVEATSAHVSGPQFGMLGAIMEATTWGPGVKASERSADEISGLRGDIMRLMEKLEMVINRPISIQVDGRELALVVGENQEALGVTA